MIRLQKLLDTIATEQRQVGEPVASGAASDTVRQTADAVARSFGAILPESYGRFLRLRNGLDFNGLSLYHADTGGGRGDAKGLLAANRAWRQIPRTETVLVLGDSDMDIYTVALDGGAAGCFDRVSGDPIATYDDVDAMLVAVLARYLAM